MSILTNLIDAKQRDARDTIYGRVLTRPTLSVTDGQVATYACSVDIGVVSPQGYDQTENLWGANINGSTLHNVPIARGNHALLYAEVGSPVTLKRSMSGRYEIVGFSKAMPGTNTRIAVDLQEFTIGQVEDLTILSRPVMYGELAGLGGYGNVPYGSVAIYQGAELIEITS